MGVGVEPVEVGSMVAVEVAVVVAVVVVELWYEYNN